MIRLLVFLLLITNFSLNAQNIIGKWVTTSDNYRREAYIGSDYFFIETYYGDTQIKMFESYLYMSIDGETMRRSPRPLHEQPKEVSTYHIDKITKDELIITDVSNKKQTIWTNVDHKAPDKKVLNYNEFYFNGAIACTSEQAETDYNNCLNFKKVNMKTTRKEIEGMFGKPYQVIEQNGEDNYVYLISDQEQDSPYFVIIYDGENTPKTLQLSGNTIGDEYAFSGIRLGDAGTYVKKRLGEPSKSTKIDENMILWSFAPFPISIELKGGLVYSIRLNEYEQK